MKSVITVLFSLLILPLFGQNTAIRNVRDYGATGDGKTSDTAAIQAAIDDAARLGGGTVFLPAGRYLSGTVRLVSGITLELSAGSVLEGSIGGEGIQGVAIRGSGTIEGGISLRRSNQVLVREVTVRKSPQQGIAIEGGERVTVDSVTVLDAVGAGIEIRGASSVRVSNCHADATDSAILVAGGSSAVTVTGCVLRSNTNGIRIVANAGDARQIGIGTCVVEKRTAGGRASSGMLIESAGGSVQEVTVTGLSVSDAAVPFTLRAGETGVVSDVMIGNAIAVNTGPVVMAGRERRPIERISMSDVSLTAGGGGAGPAYAFHASHVQGLTLRNLKTRWNKEDQRPALLVENSRRIEVSGFRSDTSAGPQPVIWLRDVDGALLTGCRVPLPVALFLRVSGEGAANISVLASDLHMARRPFEVSSGASRSALWQTGNLTSRSVPHID